MQNKYRILVVGDTATGKTSIIQRYIKNTFRYDTCGTIQIYFNQKQIQVHGNDLNISIIDTSGNEKFRIHHRYFYRKVAAIIIVYDVGFRQSFDNLDFWFKDFTDYGNEGATITLVGNKIDMPGLREVSYEEGLQKVQENNALFFETSVRYDINIKEIFQKTMEKTINQDDKLIQLDSLEIESTMKKNQKNQGQNCF